MIIKIEYIAIIGDIKESKKIDDRNMVQEKLNYILNRINQIFYEAAIGADGLAYYAARETKMINRYLLILGIGHLLRTLVSTLYVIICRMLILG